MAVAQGDLERDHLNEETPLIHNFNDCQSHVLSRKKLLVVFPSLAFSMFLAFLDQTAISTSLPAIAAGLEAGASISWVGASFLISSTGIQLINGRLSDIFGRRMCLSTALTIMGIGNLLSGFSRTPAELYLTRAFAGFGAGAINALVQIGISDITTLEQRGYYFGFIGIAIALGNGLGPVVGGWLTEKLSWRWAFWFISPLTAIAVVYLGLVWPQPYSTKNTWEKLKLIDWWGAITSLLSIILILVPISLGGSELPWSSPITIIMLVLGILLLCLFLLIEWRLAQLPILPMRVFQYGHSNVILIGVNFIIGCVFWGNLFWIPLYLQNIRGWSPAKAGLFLLPTVITHGVTSALTGVIISFCGRYTTVIRAGAACWCISAAAKLTYTQFTPSWLLLVAGALDGIGVGCSLQPVLVGILAGSHSDDRAVLTGLRNFLRETGGAMGITLAGAILSNVLFSGLKARFTSDLISQLTSSTFNLASLNLSEEEKLLVSAVYMKGLHAVVFLYLILANVYFIACWFIEDCSLNRKVVQNIASEEESSQQG
ncbi:major facilitator superfamily domain-containing protein [Aspergillus alliaceus]|uniref:major facilitator superfamily domain-containing protein n=1 Tax=Petromyces alliaceus TaxID=209559 RepID=UPI0012A73A9A|nr:major facilitator superfamily domain-containing protein [Aspergillus alliaceus]KAB8231128.1 major facilitator superfamily domain-containing protein [Aspergillus alliaceus]